MTADGGKDIKGAKGGESQRKPVEAPDSLNSIASAHILDLLGEGEFAGWYSDNPLKDVFLDETPVMNADGSMNFTNIHMDWREGTQDQSYMVGFPAVENEIGIGVELRSAAPWTRAISNTSLSAVRVRLSVASLSNTNTSNGDINGYSVRYAIDLATDGGAFEEVLQTAFTGKTTTKYERMHRIDLPAALTGWVIRVRRLTADTEATFIQDTTAVESITEVIDMKLRYPNSALVGIKMDAAQFRNIPTRGYRKLGRLMRIPSNYNPVTRVYTGAWDGTFQIGWTSNPAWIFYDLVTNQRFGLGEYVDETQVDKWSLYQIAQYCDELVPDGKGGMEPRFACTVFFQRQEEAYKVLQDLASVFRGISYWGSGAVIPVGDIPRDPAYTYTNANVKDGKFSYQGSTRRARHTVALVSWSDPSDFNRQKVEYVEDPEGIARYGIQITQITAVGCTSQGQAQRMGRWILLTERFETDTVTFSVGLDQTLVLPGTVIRVADAKRAGRRTGGRVRAATATDITVDFMPVVAIGDDLICITPAGVAEKRPVSNIVGDVITVNPAYSAAPVEDSVWAVESPTLKTQLYSVISIGEGEGLTAVITALQHEPGKYDAVDQSTVIEPRPISDIMSAAQKPPTNLIVTAKDRNSYAAANKVIKCVWTAAEGAVGYDVQWRRDDGDWSSPQRVLGTEAEFFNPFMGNYVCKVVALNGLGIYSVPAVSATYIVSDVTLTPGFVDELNADIAAALTEAENAQATADGAIVSFWQTTAPVIGAGAGQAKEGDIWFETDNGNKIYRVVSGVWTVAADDDMAQALAAASTAQSTADGKVKTFFAATAPTAEAVGDLWFNTTTKKLFRWNGSNWNSEIADVTLDQLGGNGINCQDDKFVTFPTLPPASGSNGGGSAVSVDTTDKIIEGALVLNWTTTGAIWYYFGPLAGSMYLTAGSYIVSAWVKANAATQSVRFIARKADATSHGSSNAITGAANTWQRISTVITLASDGVWALALDPNTEGAPVTWKIDGVMVEQQIGTKNTASAFVRGSLNSKNADAIAAAAAAQDTADGKIETFFQTSMPSGASLGDLWFDTDDGNKVWRHNGTTFVEIQDDAIAQAINAAAGAQATADGKVTTFYASTAPTAEAVGDLWYNTTAKVLSRWNGSAWIQVGDITADKLAGAGVNLMNEEYTSFKSSLTLNASSNPAFYATALAQLITVSDATAVSGYSLRALTLGTNTGASWAYFGSSATDYSMALEGGKKYLLSFFGKASASGHLIRFTWVGDDGVGVNASANIALTGGYNRYTVELDLTGKTTAKGILLCYFNVSGVDARYVYLDRLMIEEKVGNNTTPSVWTPGVSWKQTLIAIANAASAQATADGKIDSFYQATAPTVASEGDIWFDTDDGNKIYTRRSGSWVATPDSRIAQAITDAAGAQATADGKVTTFYQTATPTAVAVGDLWYNKSTMELKRWNGSSWIGAGAAPSPDGSNLVPNANFDSNSVLAGFSNTAINDPVADGWLVKARSHPACYAGRVSPSRVLCQVGNDPIVNGGVAQARVENTSRLEVVPSATYLLTKTATVNWNGSTPPAGISAEARVYVQWLAADNSHISYSIMNTVRGGAAWPADGLDVIAPSTAKYALISCDVIVRNNSGATWTHDSTVPINCYFDFVSLVKKSNMDVEIADGTDYGRTYMGDLFMFGGFRRVGLRVGTSGHRLGNQRNIPRSNTSAYGMVRTTTALSATSAGAVSVNAHTVRYGGYSVTYNAVANAVTGLTVGTTYVIYCTDADLSGGTKTYFAGTNPEAVMNISDDIYVVGQITIPSSGSSSGGSGSGGTDPNDWCVDADMVLPDGRRAGDVKPYEAIPCWNDNAEHPGIVHLLVESNHLEPEQESHMIVTASGACVTASDSTPMTLRDGRMVRIPEMLGEEALVRSQDGALRWEQVVKCVPVGRRTVAKIKVHQRCYFAGMVAGATIATHNPTVKP